MLGSRVNFKKYVRVAIINKQYFHRSGSRGFVRNTEVFPLLCTE